MGDYWQAFRGSSFLNQLNTALCAAFALIFFAASVATDGALSIALALGSAVSGLVAVEGFNMAVRNYHKYCTSYIAEQVGVDFDSEEFREYLIEERRYRWADRLVDVEDGGGGQ